MKKMFDNYAARRDVAASELQFFFSPMGDDCGGGGRRRVLPEHTPIAIALREGDRIDCTRAST